MWFLVLFRNSTKANIGVYVNKLPTNCSKRFLDTMQISIFQLIRLVLNFHLTHETVVFCNKTFVVCIHYNVFAYRCVVNIILHPKF